MKAVAKKSNSGAPTAREINEAHRLARQSAESAVEHAIRCGQMLIARKDAGEHGDFEEWVSKNCDFAASTARKYMKAARQNATGVAFSSLQSLFPSGTSERPKTSKEPSVPNTSAASAPKSGESLPAAGRPVSADGSSPAPGANESKREAPAPQAQQSNQSGATIESAGESRAASASPGASLLDSGSARPSYSDEQLKTIADEHERVVVAADPDEPEKPSDEEMSAADEDLEREYQAAVAKVLEKGAEAVIREQAARITALEQSRDHYMREKTAAVQTVKSRDRTIAKLERDNRELLEQVASLRERVAIMEDAA